MGRKSSIAFRIYAAIALLSLLFAVAFFVFSNLKVRQKALIIESASEQFKNEVVGLIDANSRIFKQVTFDYTYWDEFYVNVKEGNDDWFNDNIATILPTYHIDFVYLFDAEKRLIYKSKRDIDFLEDTISVSMLDSLLSKRLMHYFFKTDSLLLEYSAATIHPTSDPSHMNSLPKGMLILVKAWTKEYIESFSKFNNTTIRINGTLQDSINSYGSVLSSNIPVMNWEGGAAANINISRDYPFIDRFTELSNTILFTVFIAFLSIFIIFNLLINRWIARPVKIISAMLMREKPSDIALLSGAPKELENIGALIISHEQQERDLIDAKNRAEESDRLKSAFLANVSHEIRTPMNGILGFAELLRKPNISNEDKDAYLAVIEESGRRMLNIINDLVDMSIIEAGQLERRMSGIDLDEMMDYLINFFTPYSLDAGLEIKTGKGIGSGGYLKSDKEKLYAIFVNLIKNGIKYTKEGYVEFGYTVKSRETEFYVKDTGIGIPEDKIDVIFDRFVQVDFSFSMGYEGAGLGLSIVKAYVDLLGGSIWIKSKQGEGSTFFFTIPNEL